MIVSDRPHSTRAALVLLCAVALLGLALVSAGALAATAVCIMPASGLYGLGQEIAARLYVEDVAGLYGAEIRLSFDAERLQVVDANPALPGVQLAPSSDLLSPDFVIRNEADNVAGTAWFAVTQINPSPPVTGSGTLFDLTFVTVGTGQAAVTVTHQVLSDRDANVLPAIATGAEYQIESTMRVFLPFVSRPHVP